MIKNDIKHNKITKEKHIMMSDSFHAKSSTLFNFNIHNLYSIISSYLHNPILYRIDNNTYGFKLKTLSRQTVLILCKSKRNISSDIQTIHLKDFYWNSFQIRSIAVSSKNHESIPNLPSITINFTTTDSFVKDSLSTIKVLNNKTIVGYPEFSLLMIDDDESKYDVIDNLYQALKSCNVLIYLNK